MEKLNQLLVGMNFIIHLYNSNERTEAEYEILLDMLNQRVESFRYHADKMKVLT